MHSCVLNLSKIPQAVVRLVGVQTTRRPAGFDGTLFIVQAHPAAALLVAIGDEASVELLAPLQVGRWCEATRGR